MEYLYILKQVLVYVLTAYWCYQTVVSLCSLVKLKDKPYLTNKNHKFMAIIPAHNEEAVVANLIESLKNQTYDKNLYDIYVIADNCTDNTAEVARNAGAIVFERFDPAHKTKGYALQWFLKQKIEENADYDAFFVFDADNIVDKDFIVNMNKKLCQGEDVVQGYRDIKNPTDNWITAGYALFYWSMHRLYHLARYNIGLSPLLNGTGFMVKFDVVKPNGWETETLTEDIEFTADCIANGVTIGYCERAEFYDEQPTRLSVSWHQRMRWVKGYFQVYRKYGRQLLSKIGKKGGFSCFDMLMSNLPAFILTMVATFAGLTLTILALLTAQDFTSALLCVCKFTVNPSAAMLVLGIYTTLTEWKHIHMAWYKKIGYMFTFPIYMLTYIPIAFVAMFKKVEWKPIAHGSKVAKVPVRRIAS